MLSLGARTRADRYPVHSCHDSFDLVLQILLCYRHRRLWHSVVALGGTPLQVCAHTPLSTTARARLGLVCTGRTRDSHLVRAAAFDDIMASGNLRLQARAQRLRARQRLRAPRLCGDSSGGRCARSGLACAWLATSPALLLFWPRAFCSFKHGFKHASCAVSGAAAALGCLGCAARQGVLCVLAFSLPPRST